MKKSNLNSKALAKLDQRRLWHPFTQMKEWLRREPIVIIRGRGSRLWDAAGKRYLDGNSSIWTNLHGHNHPAINRAIQRQLKKIAHVSALGLANEPASLLGEQLVRAANFPALQPRLEKVFYSDDGSTAMEAALKMAYEHSRRSRGLKKPRFLSLAGAYHGDTIGAVSLGHIDLFHHAYRGLLFRSDAAMAPYCYRCPFNRARPERLDARQHRRCHWECLGQLENKFQRRKKAGQPYAGFIFEPLMQGPGGMIAHPSGWLQQAATIARGHGALLLADEVMTGFGRTGCAADDSADASVAQAPAGARNRSPSSSLFACHHEEVQPDFMALAKGLTGGYLPMAATLATEAVFNSFLGEHHEFKTFFHGHSFTANPLGASAALASLGLLQGAASQEARRRLQRAMSECLPRLWKRPAVGDIRQVGLIAGVELVRDWRTRQPFELRDRAGIRVCEALARRGVLTRPIGNVIVLMPPYSTRPEEIERMVQALDRAIKELFNGSAMA